MSDDFEFDCFHSPVRSAGRSAAFDGDGVAEAADDDLVEPEESVAFAEHPLRARPAIATVTAIETSDERDRFIAFPPPANKNGFGLAAVIIGAVALLLALIPAVNVFAVILALVGVILGVIGLTRKTKPTTKALIGTILSGVAAILAVIMIVVYAAVFVRAIDESMPSVETSETAAPNPEDASTEAPAEEPAAEDVGTRKNPAAIGTTVTMTQAGADTWEVTPGAPNLNAVDLVAAANQFNDPAPAGYQWAVLPLHVAYVGSDSATPFVDIRVSFVGADGKTYEEYNELASGYVDGQLSSLNEMYSGASGDGNVLILVPSANIEQGVWAISPLFGDPYFFKAQ